MLRVPWTCFEQPQFPQSRPRAQSWPNSSSFGKETWRLMSNMVIASPRLLTVPHAIGSWGQVHEEDVGDWCPGPQWFRCHCLKTYSFLNLYPQQRGFPGGDGGKEPSNNAGYVKGTGSSPGSERSPGGKHGNPLWYSCLENPMNREAWMATVQRVKKSQTQLKWLSTLAGTSTK